MAEAGLKGPPGSSHPLLPMGVCVWGGGCQEQLRVPQPRFSRPANLHRVGCWGTSRGEGPAGRQAGGLPGGGLPLRDLAGSWRGPLSPPLPPEQAQGEGVTVLSREAPPWHPRTLFLTALLSSTVRCPQGAFADHPSAQRGSSLAHRAHHTPHHQLHEGVDLPGPVAPALSTLGHVIRVPMFVPQVHLPQAHQ